ncbi:MAG: glycosyltransferase family 2 protein [Rhodobiaceae bacterium]|nr:glycosyltransferase family 2 protein [Rhodobiaceae bacterium]MCC0049158.1 glycosyltransferase family 2 protein [Rhodobiaceae bacterium]
MISAAIITLNEESNIGDCIESVRALCDDIVVLDSGSSDRTREIAEEKGARVFTQSYLGDGPQKNRAVELAASDWVLSIDADERATPELCAQIRALDVTNAEPDAYRLRRKTYIGNRWIAHNGWYPDRIVRLFDRRKAAFTNRYGHARVEGGKVTDLDGDLLHYSFDDIAQLIYGQKFAIRDALAFYEQGKTSGPVKPVLHGIWGTFRSLVLRGGCLQGIDGFTVAMSSGLKSYMKYAILNEMHRDPEALASYRKKYGRLIGEKK